MNLTKIGISAGLSYLTINHLLIPNNQTIYALINRWINTVTKGSPQEIADLYSKEAILLGTFAQDLTLGREEILKYFIELKQKPNLSARIVSFVGQGGTNAGIASGIYEFSWNGGKAAARYSFVFQKSTFKTYQIINHHSSLVPE